MKKRIQGSGLDESSILTDARKILAPQIEDLGMRCVVAPTIMVDRDAAANLARVAIGAVRS